MTSSNIVKKLEKQGFTVEYSKWCYWDHIPVCNGTAIAKTFTSNGSTGIITDFKFDDVLSCIGKYADMSQKTDINGEWLYKE